MAYVSSQKLKEKKQSGYVSSTKLFGSSSTPSRAASLLPSLSAFGTTKTSTPQTLEEGKDTKAFVKNVLQGVGRGYIATGQAIQSGNLGTPFVQAPEDTFSGQLTRRLSGTSEPISLAKEDIDLFGENLGGKSAGMFTAGLTALDLFSGGAAKGLVGAVRGLKVAKTAAETAPILKGLGFADDIVEQYAPMLAKLEDAKEIENALRAAEKLQNTTQTVSKTDPLITEARKYGSAEEFADAVTKNKSLQTPELMEASGVSLLKKESADDFNRYMAEMKAIPEGIPESKMKTLLDAIKEPLRVTDEQIISRLTQFYTKVTRAVEVAPSRVRSTANPAPKEITESALPLPPVLTDAQRVSQTAPLPERTATQDLEKILLQTPDGQTSKALQPKGIEAQTPSGPVESPSTQNIPQSRVVQGAEATTKKPVVLDDSTYQANRETLKKGGLTKVREGLKDTFDSVGKGADVLLGSISTRLGNIDPSLKTAIRKYEFKLSMAVQKDHKRVMPFLKALKKSKINAGDYADLDLALKNGDVAKTDEMLKKYGLTEEFKAIRSTLDDLYERATKVGYDIGYEENYVPRTIKDSGGLLEYLEKGDDWSLIDDMIKAREEALQRYLTTDEKAGVINNLIRGYGGKITLTETGAMKARQIDMVDANLNQFYNDSLGSLINYIDNTNDAIEARRFFGKTAKAEQFGNIDDSIGSYILNLLADGKIKPSQEKELTRILRARFNEVGTSGAIQAYKNLSYIDTMGSFTSAVTQIGDLAFALYAAGPVRTARALGSAIAGKSNITRADLGIEKIAAEFSDSSKTAKAVSAVFKLVGLEKMDSIGKETLVNSIMQKLSSQAKKPNSDFYKQLESVFGDDVEAIARTVEDLKAGRVTEDTKLLAFNKLTDFQPIALSEMPEMYLKGGNGRIFYMLKTYTVKLFDVYRNEIFKQLSTPGQRAKGLKNMVALGAALVAANATADEIKDFMLNRETSLTDRTVDNILRLVGFSKYTVYKAREEGIGSAVLKTILPPIKFIDSVYKDIAKGGEGGLETIGSIPVGGKLYYWWFGKGAAKTEKKRGGSEFGGGSAPTSGELPLPDDSGGLSSKQLPLPPGL